MSYSNPIPPSREELFIQIHQDIHETGKDKQHLIQELTRQGQSYSEAEHLVNIAADQPNPKIALEQFRYRPYPRRSLDSYRSNRPDHPSGCLALYLGLSFIYTIVILILIVTNPRAVFGGDVPTLFIIFVFLLSIIPLYGIAGTWNLQKSGLYTLIGLSCFNLVLNTLVIPSFRNIASAIVQLVLLFSVTLPYWDEFE